MAARVVQRLPEGDEWMYEVKFDGYGALMLKNGESVQIRSRNNKDLTRAYPGIHAAGLRLRAETAVVGGEIVAVNVTGRPSFQALQHRPAHLGYGIGAAVIAIIARSAYKLTKLTLARNLVLWGIFAVMAVTTAWAEREIISLFVMAGVVTAMLAGWRAPRRSASMSQLHGLGLVGLTMPASGPLLPSLPQIFWVFAKAGAFVFGSGLAIVPFLRGELVQTLGWLNDRQFLDAVAVAMITPGPVVITVAFIGYLVAGPAGMTVAALGVFLPVYLFGMVPAPYFRRHRTQPVIKGFVEGVSAAATGAIAGAAYVLATRALIDMWTAGIALATFFILTRWKISELWLIGAAGLIGLLAAGARV